MGKWCLQATTVSVDRIFVKLPDKQDRHNIGRVWILAKPDRSLWSYVFFIAPPPKKKKK